MALSERSDLASGRDRVKSRTVRIWSGACQLRTQDDNRRLARPGDRRFSRFRPRGLPIAMVSRDKVDPLSEPDRWLVLELSCGFFCD
jgi:hypothetical protein